jgi:hypothetical protein
MDVKLLIPNVEINLPFPPQFDPKKFSKDKEGNNNKTRTANGFIIYRSYVKKYLQNLGHTFTMTIISSISSASWNKEPDFVKDEYKRLANSIRIKKEIKKKKRIERWSFVHCSIKQINSLELPETSNPNFVNENHKDGGLEKLSRLDDYLDKCNTILIKCYNNRAIIESGYQFYFENILYNSDFNSYSSEISIFPSLDLYDKLLVEIEKVKLIYQDIIEMRDNILETKKY